MAGLVLTTACGSRLSREEILAENTVTAAGAAGPGTASSIEDGTDVLAPTPGDDRSDGDTRPGPSGQGSTNAPNGRAGPGRSTTGDTGDRSSGGPSSSSSGSSGSKSAIVIGMVGWLSGLGGQTAGYSRDSLVAWSKWVNAKGGINGHPVQLLIGDDGGNESRSVTIVRDFVENKGAVAIVNYAGSSAVGVANYARERRVPIVGGAVVEPVWTQNPMLFPHRAATQGKYWGAARLTKEAGAKRVATVYCVEIVACQESNAAFVGHAREEGLEVVDQQRISATQPDYTAECLRMQNADVEVVVTITENSSAVRLAQSCGRQEYRPTWNLQLVNDSMPGIAEFEGAIGNLGNFPWFLRSGSPGIEEFVQAVQRYAPNRVGNAVDTFAEGWVAGKLFEKAAQNVSDKPTKEEILEGLWRMKGETLDGLLTERAARTFTRDRPTPETFCVFEARIRAGKWTAPRGLTPVCR